jgi:hypothetical protein
LLSEFKKAIEARALDTLWTSRKKGILRPKPEEIVQGALAMFARGVLGNDGLVLREIASGVGFVDVGIAFGKTLHLVELKILKGQLTGPNQLAAYMRTEQRREGWLLLIDVRKTRSAQNKTPETIDTPDGVIRVVIVDANPHAPHSL